ncbi:MAG TPA: carbamoyltransferase N-terminal domain-containing protein [Myxococcota bacterium]|nr:carbamoyltransferase N-terminal domain-containing protein [Myxococcota bacterium]HRY94062.1 carbamoyltransferase N-terminal domain-containing protein [Myxococcota bacterium]HSA21359.1 carbamoyltransferase N-terminal domain-containing protein [Myxococcota bacterium]
MTAILGISAFYHDAAAAVVLDGRIAAAAQEERFSRIKHDASFPGAAIAACLRTAGLRPEDIDYVGFYEKPLAKFERLLETSLATAPRGMGTFLRYAPLWLRRRLHIRACLDAGLGLASRKRYIFGSHHLSHAASAFYPSPFPDAAVLTLDGVGEWATTCWGTASGNRISLSQQQRFPHSLGLLYSAFTHHCGFKINSGEYKLMGLAPFGRPTYARLILERVLDLKPDGSFRLDLSYFCFHHSEHMTSRRFDELFGGPARRPEAALTQREMDLAASIQAVCEEVLLRAARHVQRMTHQRRLCLAGGVALNAVANGRLAQEGPFEEIWIQPAAGDAGGALGVALYIWHALLDRPRLPDPHGSQGASWLGPEYSDLEVRGFLDSAGARYRHRAEADGLLEEVARLLASGLVVGWMQGRMEFGPRALGARSILADPRHADMQARLNHKIKFRESFRPFAPAVLADRAAEYFTLGRIRESPHMLLVTQVAEAHRLPLPADAATRQGLELLRTPRSDIPAVTHVDGSARIQTVDPVRHGRFERLLREFARQTGCPLLINTSFNVRGEPVVCSPGDAWRCFMATDMDALVIGEHVLLKADQAASARPSPGGPGAGFPLD